MKRTFNFRTILSCLLVLSLFSIVSAQDSQNKKIDWSSPFLIDPLRPGIGDFLETDLAHWIWRANEAYRQKNYKEAAKLYLYVLRHNYSHAQTIYSLACCYGLLGEVDLAVKYLIRAANAGYMDIEHIKEDPDFDKVRGKLIFDAAILNLERWVKKFGSVIYVESAKLLKCRVQFPENFDPDKSYPLLIGLHGNGGNAEEFVSLWSKFNEPEFIFAAPQAAYLRTQDVATKFKRFSWGIPTRDKELWKKGDLLTEKHILQITNELTGRYKTENVYLLGFSQGAAFTYITGLRNPDIFKGIICFGGRLPDMKASYSIMTEKHVKNAKNLKVFIAHGKEDNNFSEAKDTKNYFEKNGYQATFREFNGGHEVPAEVLREVQEWMKR